MIIKILISTFLVSFSAMAEKDLEIENENKIQKQNQEELESEFFMPHKDLDPENWQSVYEKMEQEKVKTLSN